MEMPRFWFLLVVCVQQFWAGPVSALYPINLALCFNPARTAPHLPPPGSPCHIASIYLAAFRGATKCHSPLQLLTGQRLRQTVNCNMWEASLYATEPSNIVTRLKQLTVELLIGSRFVNPDSISSTNYRQNLRFLSSRVFEYPSQVQGEVAYGISNYTIPYSCKDGSDSIAALPCDGSDLSLYLALKTTSSSAVVLSRVSGPDSETNYPKSVRLTCSAEATSSGCGGGGGEVVNIQGEPEEPGGGGGRAAAPHRLTAIAFLIASLQLHANRILLPI